MQYSGCRHEFIMPSNAVSLRCMHWRFGQTFLRPIFLLVVSIRLIGSKAEIKTFDGKVNLIVTKINSNLRRYLCLLVRFDAYEDFRLNSRSFLGFVEQQMTDRHYTEFICCARSNGERLLLLYAISSELWVHFTNVPLIEFKWRESNGESGTCDMRAGCLSELSHLSKLTNSDPTGWGCRKTTAKSINKHLTSASQVASIMG